MPSKNIVKEIKADNIKDINPSDIIYLALKDGSILLVIDDDDDIIDYDDININYKDYSTRKRTNLSYSNDKNKKYKKQNKANISYTRDAKLSYTKTNNDKNSTKNKYINKQQITNINKINNNSTSNFVDRRQHKSAVLPNKNNNNEKKNNYYIHKVEKEKENVNKSFNTDKKVYSPQYNNRTNRTNISTIQNNVKLEKSFDITNNINTNKYGNHSVYNRDHSNKDNKQNTSYLSHQKVQKSQNTKIQNNTNQRNNSNNNNNNKINNNYYNKKVNTTSYSTSKTPSRKENKISIYNDKNKNIDTSNSIINISNLSTKNKKYFVNKTPLVDKKINVYKEYSDKNKNKKNNDNEIYKNINYFKRGEQTKTQIYSDNNSKTPTTKYIERKEYEIIGKIVNNDKSIKLIDHNHPNTLYDPDCDHCKKLAKTNKLWLINFKEESSFNNQGFHVSFGSSNKKEKSHSKFEANNKNVVKK